MIGLVKQEGYFKELVNKCKSKEILIKKLITDFDYTLKKMLLKLQPQYIWKEEINKLQARSLQHRLHKFETMFQH